MMLSTVHDQNSLGSAMRHHSLSHILPQSYQAWYDCMTVTYEIKLTLDYINARIVELKDTDNKTNKEFISLCGSDYHQQVLMWFEQAKQAL